MRPEDTEAPSSRPKLRDYLPSPFSGQNLDKDFCESHILKFRDYISHQGIELDKFDIVLSRFKLTLEGKARLWIEGETFDNFNDLKTAFITKFSPPQTIFQKIREYEDAKYVVGTNLDTFVDILKRLGKELNYSEKQIAHKFMLSLPIDCQKLLLITKPDGTLCEWSVAAKSYFNMDDKASPRELNFAVSELPVLPPPEENTLREEIAKLKEKFRSMENTRPVIGAATMHPEEVNSTPEYVMHNGSSQISRGSNIGSMQTPPPHGNNLDYNARYNTEYNTKFSKGDFCDGNYFRQNSAKGANTRRNFQSARNSRNFDSAHKVIFCHYCYVPGHKWRNCYKRNQDLRRREETAMKSSDSQNFQ